MSQTKLRNKSPLLAAATALAAAGLLSAQLPARALPPIPLAPANCQQFAFAGFTTLHIPEIGFDLQFTSNEPTVNTTVTRVGAPSAGNITGGVDSNGHVGLTISEQGAALRFVGEVGVAHVTDRSGVTSQCTYTSDFYTRSFRLDAN